MVEKRKNTFFLLFIVYSLIYFFILFIFYKINNYKEIISYLIVLDEIFFIIFILLEIERFIYFSRVYKIIEYDFIKKISNFINLFFLFLKENFINYIIVIFFTIIFHKIGDQFNLNFQNLFWKNLYILLKQIILLLVFFVLRAYYLDFFVKIKLKTNQIIVIGFLFLIFFGAFLLIQNFSIKNEISFVDALFMSTSAVCVTGLAVKSVSNDFSNIGKVILLFLMQIGGLGIMFLYASIVNLLPEKVSLKTYIYTHEAYDVSTNRINVNLIFRFIFIYTFFIELIGFILFFIKFYFLFNNFAKSVKYSLFHSISAFCNAGLSLFDNSFENFYNDTYINLTLIFLITAGGIGFYVGYDILRVLMNRIKIKYDKKSKIKNKIYLTSQSKLVLFFYLILNIFGAILFFIIEKDNSLAKFNLKDKILASLFQVVTSRTAGFNTVPIGGLRVTSLIILCILMFIGTASGSTGGGIKVSTFGVIIYTFVSYIKNSNIIRFHKNRRIRNITVRKAFSLFFAQISFIVLWIIILTYIENFREINIIFETFSAFGTVGLSTGITTKLKDISKIFIIIAMFIGRIGPLTLVSAMSREERTVQYNLPPADINIG
ncbi:MAG: hypothetical protein N3A58_02430 [Spirochaetes bacterium]|nr:hypothetical protein [Spirochaetota bacterium]